MFITNFFYLKKSLYFTRGCNINLSIKTSIWKSAMPEKQLNDQPLDSLRNFSWKMYDKIYL